MSRHLEESAPIFDEICSNCFRCDQWECVHVENDGDNIKYTYECKAMDPIDQEFECGQREEVIDDSEIEYDAELDLERIG